MASSCYKLRPRSSPWGRVQSAERIGDGGIWQVSTASHGGMFVPDALLSRVSAEGRAFARKWSGSEAWFEEDCAVCYVVAAFPELFTAEEVSYAREYVAERELADGVRS